MKFTNLFKAVLISAGVTAGVICIVKPAFLTATQCQSLAQTAAIEECVNVSQQSWYSWFQGNSRSTQFHFVDLLELLSRLNPTQKH